MKNNFYILMLMSLAIITTSCNKDDDEMNEPINDVIMGCTDPTASNYNPNATEDDDSCVYEISGCTNEDAVNYNPEATVDDDSCIILGCTDENAINYNPDATDDNGSCEYSNASILNGNWNIISLDYNTEIDLSFLESILGINPGSQAISGEATNAGTWSFQHPEYLYTNNLSFSTEPVTILTFEAPPFPIEAATDGNWTLINNDNVLVTTDSNTGIESYYEIISITNTNAVISGTVPFAQEIMGFAIDLDIEMEMILEKQ